MYRRAHILLFSVAGAMGIWAVASAIALQRPLIDPEGSFLGPSWLRLPLILLGALLLDLLPRTLWLSRMHPRRMPDIVRERLREHWSRPRLVLVATGLCSFYIVYVSYRNLKSFLPAISDRQYDRELHLIDHALLLGHDPAIVLHSLLGTGFSAAVLSAVYLWFLPLVPLALTAWLIWSRNLAFGYWFATSQSIAWSLGTLSYYALPTVGPGIQYVWLYERVQNTPASDLMSVLTNSRQKVLGGLDGAVQSVAGFASLHCAITLLVAMMIQYTVENRVLRIVFWVNFAITLVATIYFGWHYIADDIAGVAIALVAFYVGGICSNQSFARHRPQDESEATPAPAASSAAQD